MCKTVNACSLILFCSVNISCAAVIDPESYILKNGYRSANMGDDGKSPMFFYTERANSIRISSLEKDIAALPKDSVVLNVCDFMRGGVKATLIEQRHTAIDVAVMNYGYSGSIIACVLKYMYQNKVGTQLMFGKKGKAGQYTVFVAD